MIPTMLCHEPVVADAQACGGAELTCRAHLSRGFDARAAPLLLELASSRRRACAAESQSRAEAADEDASRLVVLAEEPRRRVVGSRIRDPPACVRDIRSEEELRKYSVDALRRMAKTCGLDLPRGLARDRVLDELSALMATNQWLERESEQKHAA